MPLPCSPRKGIIRIVQQGPDRADLYWRGNRGDYSKVTKHPTRAVEVEIPVEAAATTTSCWKMKVLGVSPSTKEAEYLSFHYYMYKVYETNFFYLSNCRICER